MQVLSLISLILWFTIYSSANNDNPTRKETRLLLDNPTAILSQLQALTNEVQSLRSQLLDQTAEIDSLKQSRATSSDGESYVIWGKKTCPSVNGTHTVYSGISAGRQFHYHGSGINTLCMPHNPDPTPSDFPTSYQNVNGDLFGTIFGAEYEFTYKGVAINDDVPCALCLASRASSVAMIPAKTSCPTGWSTQYTGVLTSGSDYASHYGTEYLCVDVNPDFLTEGSRLYDYNGKLFYPVRAVCGSLPCPPYKSQQTVSCVVCSI